ncbi:23S rRNA methyltransferase [Candidatus Izimaplasma bacterium HR1]|jgi:TrmH family RNA methyltransferase|uniref:TrmH family RNA methyltransferase n=1 Tax=Candidatus Izimoplasma sp. HR1 TaxID=1541959 RepID=UPI0004F76428|nr:23S rRNA methyltransferase [Candidatus Izimaplasma bacterium HR1]
MKITSINNKIIKDTAKLHQKKYRDISNQFLVEGYHLFEEASKVGNIITIFTTDEAIKGDKVIYVSDQVLEKLAQTKTPQPVLAVCTKIANEELSDKILILEQIQDPGNLGTLMRSALAFGFKTIVLDNTVDIYNDKVLRSTQGAIFKLNIIHENTLEFIKRNKDYKFYGTKLYGQPISNINKEGKIAIILGNEGSGVSEMVLSHTTANFTIEMAETESLNVGVAGSIIMHYITN